MKNLKPLLTCFLIPFPFLALAHGEEVFITIFLELIVIVILALLLVLSNLNITGKLIVGGIGILAIVLANTGVNKWSGYQNNVSINTLVFFGSLITILLSYYGLKNKFKKRHKE
jgi:hypothetical protein